MTANLRDARDQIVQNMGALYTEAASVFDKQLMRLSDKHGATTFGRHLGIAAYELDARQSVLAPGKRECHMTPGAGHPA